jgi:hypothetical protein
MNPINQEYSIALKESKNKRRKLALKIFIFILFLTLIAIALSFEYPAFEFVSIVLGIVSLIVLILVWLGPLYIVERPLYTIVIKDIVNRIALDKQMMIDYDTYIKEKELIKRSGLFPKGANQTNRFSLTFSTDNHTQVKLIYAHVFTQTNNSRIDYLKGLYMIITCMNPDVFQIRSKGRPRLKDVDLEKLKLEKGLTLYDHHPQENHPYLELMAALKERFKQVDIGAIEDEIHFAIQPMFKFKREKAITEEVYKDYYQQIESAIDLAIHVSESMPQ